MSGKRSSPASIAPTSGFRNIRLRWSRMSIRSPAWKARRIPPAAFETNSVLRAERVHHAHREAGERGVVPLVHVKAAGQRHHRAAAERAGDQLAGVARPRWPRGSRARRRRGRRRALAMRVASPPSPEPRMMAATGVARAEPVADLVGGHARGAAGRTATARSRDRLAQRRDLRLGARDQRACAPRTAGRQLSNPLSATRASSSKLKPSDCAACRYSSVSVMPLISRLSVLSTTLSPRSKYARKGCVS